MHTHTHAHTHAHMHTHTYIHTYIHAKQMTLIRLRGCEAWSVPKLFKYAICRFSHGKAHKNYYVFKLQQPPGHIISKYNKNQIYKLVWVFAVHVLGFVRNDVPTGFSLSLSVSLSHTQTHTLHIHTHIHTNTHTHTYIHTHMHTYIHKYKLTYIHTYIHTYDRTFIHTCIQHGT